MGEASESQRSVSILVTFVLDAALVERVRSVDPRLQVSVLGPEEMALFWGRQEAVEGAAQDRLAAALAGANVLFGFVPRAAALRDLLPRLPRLRWFQTTSAGVDRLLEAGLLQALAERGVIVTNASGLHATPIAEFVMTVSLMFAKGAHRFVRSQLRREWLRYMPSELRGKTVGVVGMGAIGTEVARLARAFGCRVLAIRRAAVERPGHEYASELLPPSGLPRLLAESDYVVLAVPLTPETRRLIDEPQLGAMKPTACLVNISRGAVVNEPALIAALKEGRIAGAALDVFEREPLPPDSELWEMDNVILSPHISGGTEFYNQRAVDIFTDNIRHYLAGEPLRNVVDVTRGY